MRRWDWGGFEGSKYHLRKYTWSPRLGKLQIVCEFWSEHATCASENYHATCVRNMDVSTCLLETQAASVTSPLCGKPSHHKQTPSWHRVCRLCSIQAFCAGSKSWFRMHLEVPGAEDGLKHSQTCPTNTTRDRSVGVVDPGGQCRHGVVGIDWLIQPSPGHPGTGV